MIYANIRLVFAHSGTPNSSGHVLFLVFDVDKYVLFSGRRFYASFDIHPEGNELASYVVVSLYFKNGLGNSLIITIPSQGQRNMISN